MAEDGLNERDAKLVQWLNEAYAKEAELEADLTAHIALTQKETYKKRLRTHLSETKEHKRKVASRLKKLGGEASTGSSFSALPTALGEVAGKAVAAVKGQVGTARAIATNQAETHLRNAQEELREEHVEIAMYKRIEVFSTEVGDRETALLARSIMRDEERMAKFLDGELTRLVKELVRAEIPKDQRATPTRSRSRRTASGDSGRATSSSRSASRGNNASSARGNGSGSTTRRSRATAGSQS